MIFRRSTNQEALSTLYVFVQSVESTDVIMKTPSSG